MTAFTERLDNAAAANRSLLCVGLDPWPPSMPIRDIAAFNRAVIDATADLVCAFKPNFAFYEAAGLDGEGHTRHRGDEGRRPAPAPARLHAPVQGPGSAGGSRAAAPQGELRTLGKRRAVGSEPVQRHRKALAPDPVAQVREIARPRAAVIVPAEVEAVLPGARTVLPFADGARGALTETVLQRTAPRTRRTEQVGECRERRARVPVRRQTPPDHIRGILEKAPRLRGQRRLERLTDRAVRHRYRLRLRRVGPGTHPGGIDRSHPDRIPRTVGQGCPRAMVSARLGIGSDPELQPRPMRVLSGPWVVMGAPTSSDSAGQTFIVRSAGVAATFVGLCADAAVPQATKKRKARKAGTIRFMTAPHPLPWKLARRSEDRNISRIPLIGVTDACGIVSGMSTSIRQLPS